MAHVLCCVHPQQRIDSPEPPSRPPLLLDGILAAAALPEDHPHTLRVPDKKPDLVASIIRSPNIATKLKSQFRRKSLQALKSEDAYDPDARPITSTEVVDHIGGIPGETDADEELVTKEQLGSVRRFSTPVTPCQRELQPDVRLSVVQSLEWLRPLLQRSSNSTATDSEDYVVVEGPTTAAVTATKQGSAGRPSTLLFACVALPQSVSSPNLLDAQQLRTAPLRRTQSFFNLGHLLSVPKVRSKHSSEASSTGSSSRRPLSHVTGASRHTKDMSEARSITDDVTIENSEEANAVDVSSAQNRAKIASTGLVDELHLHQMDISHQLRSMSAMSSSGDEDESLLSAAQPWNFHHREKSALSGSTDRSTWSRPNGNLLDALAIDPASIGRVRSPATSSIYSRPPSIKGLLTTDAGIDGTLNQAHDLSSTVGGHYSNWPLLAPPPSAQQHVHSSVFAETDAPGPLTSSLADLGSSDTRKDVMPDLALRWSSPSRRAGSVPSKDSSSHLTVSSKRSRLERFIPNNAKRAVKKRRSIFKFLRPGSRSKHQLRSVSSPMLTSKSCSHAGTFDGAGDESPALLTVEYELSEMPHHGTSRSASTSQLEPQRRETAAFLEVPTLPQRRPSLADYERGLTAAGDDRRRASSVSVQKLQEVVEDDRRGSMLLRRKLSRAKPLDDEPTGLMAQALEKHQQEKAMFRSASKHRETLESQQAAHPSSFFCTDTLTAESNLPSSSPAGHGDFLDPLEQPGMKSSAGRSHSVSYLGPPKPAVQTPSGYRLTGTNIATPARRSSAIGTERQVTETPGTGRVGTSLASWARFPSHSRLERSGPAGRADDVKAIDFAFDDGSPTTNPNYASSPVSKKAGKARASLPKRRSTTFSGIARYYSNIFSSGGNPQNRRSSVSKGGWLANPDLELLPPATSHEPNLPHHDHHFKQHLYELERELEEAVREDVSYVKQEAVKFEGHVLKEVEEVEEEAEKLMHIEPHHHHHTSENASSPFHEGSPFAVALSPTRLQHTSTYIDPMDEAGPAASASNTVQISEASQTQPSSLFERNGTLDGAADPKTPSSKAEAWSSVYKECLIRPASVTRSISDASRESGSRSQETIGTSNNEGKLLGIMGPPLKPLKARSPEQTKGLAPDARVRRFPSVTVVDDCKGHSRSVSLISIKVNADIMRSSTNDLIQLIQTREREEREKLLRGPSRASTVTRKHA